MCSGKPREVTDCRRMRADTQRTSSSGGSAESRALDGRGLLATILIWLSLALSGPLWPLKAPDGSAGVLGWMAKEQPGLPSRPLEAPRMSQERFPLWPVV